VKVKSQKDFWSGLMFIAVGAAFAWGATDYSFGASARPGPGFFPLGLGVLLGLLGAFVTFKALTLEVEGGDPIGAWAWKPLLLIAGSVALFGWLLPHLGLFIALPLLVVISAAAGDEFSWQDALICAVVLTLGSWLVFVQGLGLTIPLWPSFAA
jgi:hypothetical protein